MKLIHRSGSQLALLILGILGMADAIYLTLAHYNDQVALVCPNTGFINCESVLTSRYAYVPGTSLPITFPGIGWCLVIIALAGAGLYLGASLRWLRVAEFAWALLGLLTALYLVYAEIVQIHNLCVWCTVLHALILLMFLITLVRLREPSAEESAWELEASQQRVVQPERAR